MRTLVLLAIVPTILAAATGRIERVNFDLGAPSRQIAITATEGLDTSIEASIRRDGALYDVRDWTVLLWYGTAATTPPLGLAFTNAASGRGWSRWDIDGAMLATNGRFDVQIVASHSDGTVQEWARGYMTIRADSTSTFQPVTFGAPLHAVSNALAAAIAVASTNLQGAINAEAQARAAGDLVAMTNLLNTVNALTNGAALGATALQPPATNTLAAAVAHAATAHGVTQYGGFKGGGGDNYAEAGGAVGSGASTMNGGAVGLGAHAENGGAVGSGAQTTDGGAVGHTAYTVNGGAVGHGAYAEYGGAVGHGASTMGGGAVGDSAYAEAGGAVGANAQTTGGGAVGLNAKTSDGFAGGKEAFATTDGNLGSPGIDAIQLGTGGNSEPFSLQIYSHKLMHADGTIPVERLTLHNTSGTAHADIRALIPALPDNPNIYTPIYAATTTIAVNSTQAVYKATFGTAGTVTQSIEGLTVSDTQEARWELWLNVTNPAALSLTWQGNLDWINGTPELTVTGLYKFAMSTTGTRITGRQTYPTVYPWFRGITESAQTFLTAATNATAPIARGTVDELTYIRVGLKNGTTGRSYVVYTDPYTKVNQKTRGIITNLIGVSEITVWKDMIDKFTMADLNSNMATVSLALWFIGKTGTGDTGTPKPIVYTRPANELETAAYNAGWRP